MKVEDHIMFTAVHGDWKVGDKLTEMEDEKIAHFLAELSNTVNSRIPAYLSEVMDVEGIKALAADFDGKDLADVIVLLKSPGTSRKLGGFVNESDKKLKKLLVDVAKVLLVREVLSSNLQIVYPEGILTELSVEPPFEEEHVNFTAKHGKWIAVRRLLIDEKTPMADIARLLAAINESLTLKLPAYAGIDVKGIDKYFSEFKKVKKADIPRVVEKYLEFPAEEHAPAEFVEHTRIYALRKCLEKIGLSLDFPAKSLEKYLEKK
ncbi:DUF2666 family protein [Thermococcus sp.]